MPFQIIGKSQLGELGYCQVPKKMGEESEKQLRIIEDIIKAKFPKREIIITSMTGSSEIEATGGEYFPKIREYDPCIKVIFMPRAINYYCSIGMDPYLPQSDFILWDAKFHNIVVTTFSREAPILAFESSNGRKALGVILRPSLNKYGDYLFKTISEALGGIVNVTLVTCNHYEYHEGSIPSLVNYWCQKYKMHLTIGEDSEKNPECYHRGEKGNHIVAMW